MTALVVALSACARGESSTGVSDSTFAATMAELRRIQENSALDSAAKDAARTQVLQSRGLTPALLEQAARDLASDPDRASAVVQEIDRRARGDTTAPPLPPR